MKALTFGLLLLLSFSSIGKELKGVYITNNQGVEYADTLILCKSGEKVILSGADEYERFVQSYFKMNNLNEYGELYIEIEVKDFKAIDKKKYYHSHYDAKATFVKLTRKSHEQESVDKCS
jgi:hypothetical protein